MCPTAVDLPSGEQRDLAFYLYETWTARKYFAAHTRAQRMQITADIMTRDSQASSGYWEIVRDALADLVRIMLRRCHDKENYPMLYEHARNLRGEVWLCAFPNVFITIAPAEWTMPRPYFLQPYLSCIFAGAYVMALHMYYLMRCVWKFLSNKFGHKYFVVLEFVFKVEYQGRGMPHVHIAAWVVSYFVLRLLQGNAKDAVLSPFVRFLQAVFKCEIDVQVGNGRLNYINGYVAKDHDAVDVGMGEYRQKCATAPWLATYRLLSKSSPCIPEVAIRMASLTEFERSYAHVLLYPPQPREVLTVEGRRRNFSTRMYGFFIEEMRSTQISGVSVETHFLVWHRPRQYDPCQFTSVYRGGRHQQAEHKTFVVACRYWYELTDGYWGQMVLTQIPHRDPSCILPNVTRHITCMENFVGAIEYLRSWR